MSRGTAKKANELEAQPQLIFDAKRDTNPYWRSSLFSDVYLKNDVPREYKHLWENDEIGGFYEFYQGFVDLCVDTEHECFEKWREADTVKNWIVPIMDLLGWENNSERRQNSYMDNESFTVVENGRKQTYRPDLLYFDKPKHKSYTQKEKDIERKIAEAKDARTGTKIVVEAKYWDRLSHMNLNSKNESVEGDSASALGPELQTLKYMEMFEHDFGFLSDGKTWRLFHKDLSQGMDRRSFDFDLGNLRELALDLSTHQNEEKFSYYAKYFYYFFSKESLIQGEDSKTAPFVHEVFDYSKKYAYSIEDDLKKRFILTMGSICNALKNSCEELGEEVELDTIRNVAESHLFNILFVKSCEVRRVLPISSTQYVRVSLHEVIETLDVMNFDPDKDWDDYLRDFRFTFGKKFDWGGFEIFERFINLYEIIHDGTAKSKDFGFEVEGFKDSIFSKTDWKFAKKHKIKNKDMVDMLFNLNFIESSFKGRKYQQIPYSYFTPRQLGSIYESLLEFKLELAESDFIFTKGQWQTANLRSEAVKKLKLVDYNIARKGELFFSPNNEDRKITGSYYTPDYVVKYMIETTIGRKVEKLKAEEVLNLKVCDPAMGSGHFLAGAIDFLVSCYRTKWSDENNDDINESIEATARKVLLNSIYGVDLNPRAVKLAKMSMWLSTASAGEKLACTSNRLLAGDSLVKNMDNYTNSYSWEKMFKKEKFDGFDFVIGNPPYIDSELMSATQPEVRDYISENYKTASGNWDLYVPFFELGFNILKQGGILSLIVPNKWAAIKYGAGLREYSKDAIYKVTICDKVKVFSDAGNNPLISFMEKDGCFSEIQRDEFLTETELASLAPIEKSSLKEEWGALFATDNSLIERIVANHKTLGDSFDVENPCTVSEAYEIKEFVEDSKNKKSCFKLINTGTLDPYGSLWGLKKTTYIKGKYDYPVVSKKKLKDEMPKRFEQSNSSKIIITGMRYFECFLDSNGEYLAGKSTIIIREKKIKKLPHIQLLLNSKLVMYLLKSLYSTQGIDGGINFNCSMVRDLPLPNMILNSNSFQQKYNEISKSLENEPSMNDKKNWSSKHIKLIDDANKMVYEAFGLSNKEIKIIEDFLMPKTKKTSGKKAA